MPKKVFAGQKNNRCWSNTMHCNFQVLFCQQYLQSMTYVTRSTFSTPWTVKWRLEYQIDLQQSRSNFWRFYQTNVQLIYWRNTLWSFKLFIHIYTCDQKWIRLTLEGKLEKIIPSTMCYCPFFHRSNHVFSAPWY